MSIPKSSTWSQLWGKINKAHQQTTQEKWDEYLRLTSTPSTDPKNKARIRELEIYFRDPAVLEEVESLTDFPREKPREK